MMYPKLKEMDDVLGGAAAWENVDHTDGTPIRVLVNTYLVCGLVCANENIYGLGLWSVCYEGYTANSIPARSGGV